MTSNNFLLHLNAVTLYMRISGIFLNCRNVFLFYIDKFYKPLTYRQISWTFHHLINYYRREFFFSSYSEVRDFLSPTIYLDIASIKIYYSPLAGRNYFFVAVRECQLPPGVPLARNKPDAIVRSTILGRTAHNISYSHHPPTLYRFCAPSSFAAHDWRKSGTGTELTLVCGRSCHSSGSPRYTLSFGNISPFFSLICRFILWCVRSCIQLKKCLEFETLNFS